MQESVPLDEKDLQTWLKKHHIEYKKLRRNYLSKRDFYLTEDDYDPEAAEHFKTQADLALGRMILIETIQSRLKKTE